MAWFVATVVESVLLVCVSLALVGVRLRLRPIDSSNCFTCLIRVRAGAVAGLGRNWPRRTGRAAWCHDVLLVRTGGVLPKVLALPIATVEGGTDRCRSVETRRLGREPVQLRLVTDDGCEIVVATSADAADRLVGPFLLARTLPTHADTPHRRSHGSG